MSTKSKSKNKNKGRSVAARQRSLPVTGEAEAGIEEELLEEDGSVEEEETRESKFTQPKLPVADRKRLWKVVQDVQARRAGLDQELSNAINELYLASHGEPFRDAEGNSYTFASRNGTHFLKKVKTIEVSL